MIIPALDCLHLADKASNSTATILAQPIIPLLARQLQYPTSLSPTSTLNLPTTQPF